MIFAHTNTFFRSFLLVLVSLESELLVRNNTNIHRDIRHNNRNRARRRSRRENNKNKERMVSERYTQSHTETKYTKCVYIFAKQFHFCKLSIYKSVAWSGSEKKNQWRIIWEILCARNCWCRIHFIYELVSHSWPHASAFCCALSLPFWERQYSRHTIQNISKFFYSISAYLWLIIYFRCVCWLFS